MKFNCKAIIISFSLLTSVANAQLVPSWSVSDATICFGTAVTFNNLTTYSGNLANVTYQWNFSNGQSSTQENPAIIFTDTGYISVILTATDSTLGIDSTVTQNNIIHIQPMPIAKFFSDENFAQCYPESFNFMDSSISDYIVSWQWNFGDGTSSTIQNPVHTYISPDSFDVKLIIMTSYGCQDSLLKQGYIVIDGPSATLNIFPDTTCANNAVVFTMQNAKNVEDFYWDFGDGSGEAGLDSIITHVYTQSGIFYPSLLLNSANNMCYQINHDTVFIDACLETTKFISNFDFNFKIYPNPAGEAITILFPSDTKNYFYEIFDITGRKIEKNKIIYSTQKISLKNFSNGIYLLKISDGEKIYMKKFIKE